MCKSLYMSELPAEREVPRWDTADRMRKALREADIGVQEMAAYLGVARNTVSTWINGRIEPSTQTLRLWALRTGVSYVWLTDSGSNGGQRETITAARAEESAAPIEITNWRKLRAAA